MAKKEKEEEKKDPMDVLTKGIKAQFNIIRLDEMGKFQNEIVDLVSKRGLMPQEICFVLDRIKQNVMDNFNQAMIKRQAKDMLKEKK